MLRRVGQDMAMQFESASLSGARPPAGRRDLGCRPGAPVANEWLQIDGVSVMLGKYVLFLLALPLCFNSESQESQACAATINELRVVVGDQRFPLKWVETTMTDKKPLVVSILEQNGTLLLEFIKTSEGLWAESRGVICGKGVDLEIRFTAEQIRV